MVEGNPGPAGGVQPASLLARATRELTGSHRYTNKISVRSRRFYEPSRNSVLVGVSARHLFVPARQFCELRHNSAQANRELTEPY
jgi:hypothetical protein